MATYQPNRSVPLTIPTALNPAENEDALIKPKPIPNPVLASGLHSALNREIKIKSKTGSLRDNKSELEKAFRNRKIKSNQKEVIEEKTPIENELGKRLLGESVFTQKMKIINKKRKFVNKK